jgi:phage tail sheath gpL-like
MRSILKTAAVAALLAGVAFAGKPSAASAVHDGAWSVLIITEKGDCDRAYRYALKVADGQVRYDGNASVNMAGTVTPTGVVQVSIKMGGKGANGSGHLTASNGVGTWHGIGGTNACSGRWEAERL